MSDVENPSAHTPGPWSIASWPYIHVRTGAEQPPFGASGTTVLARDHVSQADALLIAAAPTMLAALIALVPADFDEHPDDFMPEWHAARAAISLATGETSNGR